MRPISLEGYFHSPFFKDSAAKFSKFCDVYGLRLPTADDLLVPLRSNSDGEVVTAGSLHEVALMSIMTEVANWRLTIASAVARIGKDGGTRVLSIGMVDAIPASLVRESRLNVIKFGDADLSLESFVPADLTTPGATTPSTSGQDVGFPDTAVAVVGMACKFPGANSAEEFWKIISSGTSMLQELPPARFNTKDLRRSPKLKFYGNYISNVDAFDHRFFKKSGREAQSMDPQQRLLLQCAYEAMESAGYWGETSELPDDIGCYIGVCATDYDDNVSSHNPTAFSSVGTLRAFLAGRISHTFGWTGPSITYDTACSSSAVAIDAACKAIHLGECSQAIAGGATVFTSPYFYQNLAAASFLSPTGQCKPFDAKADGYCRGEGVGLVVLKKLSDALAAGDDILAVVASSAVNQNSNAVSITVPHSPSQMKLYQKVAKQAGINPADVSYVEAHGTGTPVGDPLEFESIKQVFGGSHRQHILSVASVKGNIGHLEGASGVAALIKTILMMHHNTIPMQASHTTLNPKITGLEVDKIMIPTTSQAWDAKFKIACVNNYGASGSNAAMIICQPPSVPSVSPNIQLSRYPIFLSANSPASLSAYCTVLLNYVSDISTVSLDGTVLASIAYNLAKKQNRSLPHVLATTIASLADLREQLATVISNSETIISAPKKVNPLVLAFGGQVNNHVGLSKEVFDSSNLLRTYLDRCDRAVQFLGHQSIYPAIFQKEPVEDVVLLHSMLFSLQYSCAQAWIDSGLHIDAVIGHSFGQLTALAISGVLSFEDGLKLVCGRASLMQTCWGPERGSMMVLEADTRTVTRLISLIQGHRLEIACYNGPTSHVCVGTEAGIQALEQAAYQQSVGFKKLCVTHGFHSRFTDPLLPGITKLARELTFKAPTIPIETCSDGRSWMTFGPELIAEHTRTAVFFGQAVERLTERFGPCTWLEAGSASSITGMVRKALTNSSTHTFHSVKLGNGMGPITDTTLSLWQGAHKVQFWPFHRSQKSQYSQLNLPPYQFEKTRHWLEWIDTSQEPPKLQIVKEESLVPMLLSFVRQDHAKEEAEFVVDPRTEEYKLYVQGHGVLAHPLCPATLYMDLVAQAALQLEGAEQSKYLPCIDELDIKAPLGYNVENSIALSMTKKKEAAVPTWDFVFSSHPRQDGPKSGIKEHATGKISLVKPDNAELNTNFDRFGRIVSARRCKDLFEDPKAESMQGKLVYKSFSKVVHYGEHYRGIRNVAGKDFEVASQVVMPTCPDILKKTYLNPMEIDSFMQTAGLHVNLLIDIPDTDVLVCTKTDRLLPGPRFRDSEANSKSWLVYSSFSWIGDKEVINDIFVFDAVTKGLVMTILGVHFHRVTITSLTKVLSRLNTVQPQITFVEAGRPQVISTFQPEQVTAKLNEIKSALEPPAEKMRKPARLELAGIDMAVRKLLARLMEIPVDAINMDSTTEEIGIDSLMLTEVISEIHQTFGLEVEPEDLYELPDVKSLANFIRSKKGGSEEDEESSNFSTTAGIWTPVSADIEKVMASSNSPENDNIVSQLAQLVAGYLETSERMQANTNLADQGLDSLLGMELANDIEQTFRVQVDFTHMTADSTFGELCDIVLKAVKPALLSVPAQPNRVSTNVLESVAEKALPTISISGEGSPATLVGAQRAFEQIRYDWDIYGKQFGAANFWKELFPMQMRLVLAYISEAFANLGCDLSALRPGDRIPEIKSVLPTHQNLMNRLHKILKEGELVISNGTGIVRSDKAIDQTTSSQLHEEIVKAFPLNAADHKLLKITGSQFSQCLTGAADPLQLLFRSKEAKDLMEEVYTSEPMCAATTELLCGFLGKAFGNYKGDGVFRILEIGGGTGGTTKRCVDFLSKLGIPFTYTFTDISSSLVAAAKRKFAHYNFMEYLVLDVEKTPPEKFSNYFHTIISVNCMHATKNLTVSSMNARKMLQSDGFVSFIEFTKAIYWFDMVYGLLKGWWLFHDGRKHALADDTFWDKSLKAAGFKHVSWTDGTSLESRSIRIITGFNSPPEDFALNPKHIGRKADVHMETLVYHQVDDTLLCADIYYPAASEIIQKKRPVALMIHGGGHIMFSRKEIRPKQTQLLLDKGFLPISIDYRLCPEVDIISGPMEDVCHALRWARETLPRLHLDCPGLEVDGSKVVVVGWSSGGHLAMTLGWTAPARHIQPPGAVLSFYAPIDYEDGCKFLTVKYSFLYNLLVFS